MASYISHYLTAKAVIEKSPENSVIKKYPDCFILGAQGGDLLFYAFGEFKGYGARTHKEKTYGLFHSLHDYCRKTYKESSVAYALGLLCHYALDSAAHPYVVYEAAERLTKLYPEHLKSCLHMMLETRIDVMMRERAESRGTTLNLKEVIPSTKRAALSLADVWSNAVNKVYGVDVPFKLLKKLPSRMYRYQSVFLKPRSVSCAVLKFAAKKLHYPAYIVGFFAPDKHDPDYDFANLEHRSYPVYTGSEEYLNCDYFQIVDNAISSSLRLIDTFLLCVKNGGTLDKNDFTINFSGGRAD